MKFRTVILFVLALCATPSLALASAFCDGFERGYITGYKQSSGSSFDPLTPLCPIKPFKGFNDPDSDYEHGYIIGLEAGYAAGRQ